MNHPDVIVVGAGLAGLFSALEFSEAGLRVQVLEKGRVGQASSWAGGGILSPLHPWRYPTPVLALSHWAQQNYPAISAHLAEETGIDPEWTRSGLLILEPEDRAAASRWAGQTVEACELIDAATLKAKEPACRQEKTAIFLPEVAQIRNPRLIKALHRRLHDAGVVILENTEVARLCLGNGRVTGVSNGVETFTAGAVVIAAGAWSERVAGLTGASLHIQPVKGQMLLFEGPGLLRHILLQDGHYLIPRRDGRILVGSTVEDAGFDSRPTAEAGSGLAEAAWRLLPGLRNCRLEAHWAGLRPGSPSGIPYVSGHPDIEGLYINAGHFRHGILTAPATARLLADLVLRRAPTFDPAAYRWPQ